MMQPPSTAWDPPGSTNSFGHLTWDSDASVPMSTRHYVNQSHLFPSEEVPSAPDVFLSGAAFPLQPHENGMHMGPEERSSIPQLGNIEGLPDFHNRPASHPSTQPNVRPSRRTNKRELPWDHHKQIMGDFYMMQGKTLDELGKFMVERHGFDAT
jgi:hypothetical protein